MSDNKTPATLSSIPSVEEFNTIKSLGLMAVKSGLLPSSINTPEKAVIIMLKGRELGIPPMQAFSSIAVVNGKPTMSAELMLSMIFRNVPGAQVNFLVSNETVCTIEAKRPNGKPTQFTFSMDDAKRANLTGKGPWVTYPAAMLRARCISSMARAVFPDALSGVVYTAEELGAEVDDEGHVVSVEPKQAEPKQLEESQFSPAPAVEIAEEPVRPQVDAVELLNEDVDPGEYKVSFGRKYKGKKLKEIPKPELESYIRWLEGSSIRPGTQLSQQLQFLKHAFEKLYPSSNYDDSGDNIPF